MESVRAQVEADDRVLKEGTVSEFLAYLNRPERAVMSHRWDVISNLAPGKGTSLYETTDYATNWYKRNLRIYTNLVAISGPGERVLLLDRRRPRAHPERARGDGPALLPGAATDFLAAPAARRSR